MKYTIVCTCNLYFLFGLFSHYLPGKLLFLDDTLFRVISRFEEEYPDCRISPLPIALPSPTTTTTSTPSAFLKIPGGGKNLSPPAPMTTSKISPSDHFSHIDTDDNDETRIRTPALSRHASNSSLHSRRALDAEEGHMHKLATFVQKQIFEKQIPLCSSPSKTDSEDISVNKVSGISLDEDGIIEPPHIREIKLLVERMDGEDIRQKVAEEGGPVGLIRKLEGVLNQEMNDVASKQEGITVAAD